LLAAIRETDPDIIALQEATPDNVELLRNAGLLKDRPYLAGEPRWGTLGYFTVSRFPLKVIPGSGLTDGQWPEMRVGGTRMIFRNVHPTPPISPFATPAWEQNLSEIPGPRGRLRVVAGDFNATFDHRDFRAVIARGYVDAGEATGNGFKWTWSAGLFRRLVIDHVLAPPSVRFSDYRVFNLPNSDHNAVAVKIQLPR
jgi:endonuclease/exonuclease/phosphatase family metal-dependent hydrolase